VPLVIRVADHRFEQLVEDAITAIPAELAALIENVAILIESRSDDPHLLGLYDGVPLTERDDYGGMVMPDRIFLYQEAICAICSTEADVRDEVLITVVHEIAHHFGIDDERLHELGWG
jgi:predicted Zn-dependent protease with MMP-like domain